MSDYQKIYTPEQLADILQTNVKRVQKLCRDGELKAFKMGNQWRVTESSLNEFINGKGEKQ